MNGWKGMNQFEKVASVLTILYAAVIIIMSVLHFTGITELPVYISYILLGGIMSLQAVKNWKENKTLAIICSIATVVVLAAAFCMIFM